MLSKKDILLAQKTFESRKLRYELKSQGRPYTPLEGKRRNPRAMDDFSLDTSLPDISSMGSPKQRPMTSMLMSPVKTSSSSSKMFVNTATQSNTMALSSSMSKSASEGALGMGITAHQELPGETQQLISELAQRGMTDQGQLRKTIGDVAKNVNATAGALDYSDPEVLAKTMSSDYYMPKVTITLPNGASLMEIYRSKQADMWGRIIKAQLKEENDKKVQDKVDKEKANEMFGKLLKDQLNDNERRRRALDGQDDYLAAITEASSKRSDDVQRQRREDAIERQKKFIMHALEDIETKRVKREKALRQEIEASTMSNNKTRALIALDEKNRAEKKAAEMVRLERLFQENQASLKRKELAKQALNVETKRIMAQSDLNYEKQEARRKDDLSKIFKRCTDGPAHQVATQVLEQHKKKEEDFYHTLLTSDNMLNKQLDSSDVASALRAKSSGKNLTAEWDKMSALRNARKAEEDERTRKLGEYNLKKLKEQAGQDAEAREKKRQAGLSYQQALDAQLEITRKRQVTSLTKTMSDEEAKINAALVSKFHLSSS